jgi:hypothetical protein
MCGLYIYCIEKILKPLQRNMRKERCENRQLHSMLQGWIKASRLSCFFGTLATAVSFRYLMLFPQIQTDTCFCYNITFT